MFSSAKIGASSDNGKLAKLNQNVPPLYINMLNQTKPAKVSYIYRVE
jgi:hypothetical protein